MDTRVYTDYNPYPGKASTSTYRGYNFTSGTEPPLLAPVNLFNSFSTTVSASEALYNKPSTLQDDTTAETSYVNRGYRPGPVRTAPSFGVTPSAFIFHKLITSVEWVTTGGPSGNGVCVNERGDWFSYDALRRADDQGTGITLTTVAPTVSSQSDYELNYQYSDVDAYTYNISSIPTWNSLKISGSYNASVFCYNQFDYTNDDKGTVFTARSLYELPEKIDNLVSFVPDQRSSTTLTYYVKVNWTRSIYWGIWDLLLTTGKKNEIISRYSDNGFGESGYDIHTVKQIVNNSNPNWGKILREILNKRQRSLEEQDIRYGQTFPKQVITVA